VIAGSLILVLAAAVPAGAQDDAAGRGTTEAAEMCPNGVISSIDVDRRAVFEPEAASMSALEWMYRTLNALHVTTVASFIRGELLFEEGDCYDPFLVSESERLLDSYGFLARVDLTSEPDGDGGRRVQVVTRDEWSTKLAIGIAYDASAELEKIELTEENFLGRGIFAQITHMERREVRAQSVGISTPRFFGRADAGIEVGRDRPGTFLGQHIRYPLLGETGRYAFRQGYSRGTSYFAYSTDGAEDFAQVLVPSFRELVELSFAQRFGPPGRSVITGITLARDVIRFPDPLDVARDDDFRTIEPYPDAPPGVLTSQLRESGATRVALHLGTRRFRYEEYEGIDGLRDRMVVGLGMFAGVSLGRGFSLFVPDGVEGSDDVFGRAHVEVGAPVGSSLLHGALTVEGRHQGGWRDVLADADLVAYLRNDGLPGHTLFLRAALAGGWSTTLPFQLALGGREGVRSLPEDRLPGGRLARFIVEDRILLPWPQRGSADLGLVAFADIGRVWPGDVPWGVDSGWQAALGLGVRLGFPSGTRNAWRADVAFPVASEGRRPIFRFSVELNRLRTGFFTPEVRRSRRFDLGAEDF
jgi:hypothetical protein